MEYRETVNTIGFSINSSTSMWRHKRYIIGEVSYKHIKGRVLRLRLGEHQ